MSIIGILVAVVVGFFGGTILMAPLQTTQEEKTAEPIVTSIATGFCALLGTLLLTLAYVICKLSLGL